LNIGFCLGFAGRWEIFSSLKGAATLDARTLLMLGSLICLPDFQLTVEPRTSHSIAIKSDSSKQGGCARLDIMLGNVYVK
jgi:hypothetical protein